MEIVKALGVKWKKPIDELDRANKMADRHHQILSKNGLVKHFLPEYMEGDNHVLDVSCGAGVFLEVIRYYGNSILGTGIDMFSLTRSQDVPHMRMDSNDVPYPFFDQSFDLVTCFGSMKKYDEQKLEQIFAEFFRIARKTVLIKLNSVGWIQQHRDVLYSQPAGWSLRVIGRTVWKYERGIDG